MPTLPSPIPHPLSFLDAPGWLRDALEYVVGTQWPEGNEKAMRALAAAWAEAARRMGPLLDDSDRAALEAVAAFGGPEGQAAQALLTLWRRLGGEPEAVLVKVCELFDDLGQLVDEAANEIEAVKLEFYIELLLMLAELLILVATGAISAGASLAGAGPIILATRMAIQRLLSKAAQKVHEKAAQNLLHGKVLNVKSGMGKFALKTGWEALEEGGQELASTAGIQAHQVNQGHRSSVDGGDMLRSFGIGTPAGGVSDLTALGGVRATTALGKFGERGLRGVSGEILGEVTVGVVTGHSVSWQGLAMASTSGTYGAAVDAPLHPMRERLDTATAGTVAADPVHAGLQTSGQTGPITNAPLAQAVAASAAPAAPVTPAPPPTTTPPSPFPSSPLPSSPLLSPASRGGDQVVLAPIPGSMRQGTPTGGRPDRPGIPDEHSVRDDYEARVRWDIQQRIRERLITLVEEVVAGEEDSARRKRFREQSIDALSKEDIDLIADELWHIANSTLSELGRELAPGGVLDDGLLSQDVELAVARGADGHGWQV